MTTSTKKYTRKAIAAVPKKRAVGPERNANAKHAFLDVQRTGGFRIAASFLVRACSGDGMPVSFS